MRKKCCGREEQGVGSKRKAVSPLFLRALLCLPGVWRPRRPAAPLFSISKMSRHSLAPGRPTRSDAPPFSLQEAGSIEGLSSASSALFLPFSTPLARSWRLFSLNGRKKSISEQFRFYRKAHFCLILVEKNTCSAHHLRAWNSPLC